MNFHVRHKIRFYCHIHTGSLQDPMSSTLGIVDDSTLTQVKSPIDGKFPISDEDRQHLGKLDQFLTFFSSAHYINIGYLDFALDASLLNSEQTIGFQFGSDGYSMAVLFRFNQALVKQYHVK